VDDVMEGVGLDPRIGPQFLRAGVGYGGSCFPKDTSALVRLSNSARASTRLLQAVIDVNYHQRLRVVELARAHLDPRRAESVAVLGLSFKPHTDDLREAPSLVVVPEFVALGHTVSVWDPVVPASVVRDTFPQTRRATSIADAVAGAMAVIVLTEWPEIVSADWDALCRSMAAPAVLIDGRNCIPPAAVAGAGVTYRGIGRGRVDPDAKRDELAGFEPRGFAVTGI
jgi:UDPglucose 6-dehydrogenase